MYLRRGARRWRKVRRINGHAFVAKRLQVSSPVLVVSQTEYTGDVYDRLNARGSISSLTQCQDRPGIKTSPAFMKLRECLAVIIVIANFVAHGCSLIRKVKCCERSSSSVSLTTGLQ